MKGVKHSVYIIVIFCAILQLSCNKKTGIDNTIRYVRLEDVKDSTRFSPSFILDGDSVNWYQDDIVPTADDAARLGWLLLKQVYGKEIINNTYNHLNITLVNNYYWAIDTEGTWLIEHIAIRKKDAKVLALWGEKM